MVVKVTRVFKTDKDKDGLILKSAKTGNPYFKVNIKVNDQEEWVSGFANNVNSPEYLLEEGKEYNLVITEKEHNGKVYKNFRCLKSEEVLEQRVKALEDHVFSGSKVAAEPYRGEGAANSSTVQRAPTLDELAGSTDEERF